RKWVIWYFENIQHTGEIKPHYNIVIPITENKSILFCLITSKVEKIKRFYANKQEKNSLIELSNKDLSCLTKNSIINCNVPKLVSKEELCRVTRNFKEIKNVQISRQLKDRIQIAILESPVVEQIIKILIDTTL
ncbi:hypothetical protein, partial [Candidatus Ruminimicrobium bovinum]|uniref:hypothetical protein n=1 Tax=Candidatus Ruminimicrobium bovinum TaxID=3242779 RepID=UPI0039B9AAD0